MPEQQEERFSVGDGTSMNPVSMACKWLFSQSTTNVMLCAMISANMYGAYWIAKEVIPQTIGSMHEHYDKYQSAFGKQLQTQSESYETHMQRQIDFEKQRFEDWKSLLQDVQNGKNAEKNKSASMSIFSPTTTTSVN